MRHLPSVLDYAYPWVFQAEPYRIRVHCLGSDAAVAGLLAINVFVGEYCTVQFIPSDDGTDRN